MCVILLIHQIQSVFNLFFLYYLYPPVGSGFQPVYSFSSSRLHWILTCLISLILIPQLTVVLICIFLLILQIALDFNLFVLSYPYPPDDSSFELVYSFSSSSLYWILTCLFSLILIPQLTVVYNLCIHSYLTDCIGF